MPPPITGGDGELKAFGVQQDPHPLEDDGGVRTADRQWLETTHELVQPLGRLLSGDDQPVSAVRQGQPDGQRQHDHCGQLFHPGRVDRDDGQPGE